MTVTREMMEQFNTAFANGDVDFIFGSAAEDIVMNEVGHSISEGKAAFIKKMEPMRGYKAEVYKVYRTLIDGDTAVVEGEMQFTDEDGPVTYFFNDWYTFENEKLKKLTAYMIKQIQDKKDATMSTGIYAYLSMDGTGEEAIDFYQEALDAEVLGVQTFGDLPENPAFPLPDEAKNRILHAQIQIGNTYLMLSDTFPGQPLEAGSQVHVCITLEDIENSKAVFEKLKVGGEVLMPLQETHWSPSYGQLKDKFGITWQISTM